MSEFRVIGRKIKRGLDLVSAFAMRCTGAAVGVVSTCS
jgi:hypothetical protein